MMSVLMVACGEKGEWREHAARVEAAYSHLKAYGSLPDSVDVAAEAAWLSQHNQPRYAGEAYYILGAYENRIGNDSTAMRHLKQAEQCWQQAQDAPPALVGMTAYKQGRISENEMLPEVALYHYRRALPYLLQSGDSLYLSSVYREIARMTQDTAEQRECFSRAMAYAEALDEALRLEARLQPLSPDPLSPKREQSSLRARGEICRKLSGMVGMERYAAEVVREALRKGDLREAEHYLEILARDTVMPVWSQRQHALLYARYLYLSGETKSAYDALESIYRERMADMENDGAVRSFTIAERFDNAAEREKNLRLEIRHQNMRLALSIGLLLVALAAAIVGVVVLRLRNSVAQKQDQLKRILLQRITQGQKLTNIFAEETEWQEFRQAFDEVYEGKLQQLEQQYPSLTTADLQVIALSELGLDSSEICQLLNQTKRTIYNRRQRIKKHMETSML